VKEGLRLQIIFDCKQAVREAAQYASAPVRRTLRPSSSPYTPYACGAQRALLLAVGAMNVRDRRQTASFLNAPAWGWGIISNGTNLTKAL